MFAEAFAALAIGTCPGLWTHNSSDPSRGDFRVEVASRTIIVAWEEGGRIEGTRTRDTSEFRYDTREAGEVAVTDCAEQSAKIAIDRHTYDLTLVTLATGPDAWCEQGVRGFRSIEESFEILTNWGPSRGEFETTTSYQTRRSAARAEALERNRFMPISSTVYLDRYDADRGGFPFSFSRLSSDDAVVTSLRYVSGDLILPVEAERAQQLRAALGPVLRATIFVVVEVDQATPFTSTYEPDMRKRFNSINAVRYACMRASFTD